MASTFPHPQKRNELTEPVPKGIYLGGGGWERDQTPLSLLLRILKEDNIWCKFSANFKTKMFTSDHQIVSNIENNSPAISAPKL